MLKHYYISIFVLLNHKKHTMPNKKETKDSSPKEKTIVDNKTCGIVMPIASMPEYPEKHWREVLKIIEEAAELAGYNARLVSESESINIIQKDIVQNLYTDEVVICDVSGRNPNVLFELGMRLTFDKPTIIIKDNITDYIFDIGPIKHIQYQKDLNYHSINEFKEDLAKKIKGTVEAYKDPKFTTFLKHFKDIKIKPATLEKEEMTIDEAFLNSLDSIQRKLSTIEKTVYIQKDISQKNQNNLFTIDDVKEDDLDLKKEFDIYFKTRAQKLKDDRGKSLTRWVAGFKNNLRRKYNIEISDFSNIQKIIKDYLSDI